MANKKYVALVTRSRGIEALIQLASHLQENNYHIVVEETTAQAIGKAKCKKLNFAIRKPHAKPKPILAVSIGGDGSFIQTASLYVHFGIPLIGVNIGQVGFLADIGMNTMKQDILNVLNGEYRDEQRIIFEVKHRRKNKVINTFTVINDVVIDRGDLSTLINLAIKVDKNKTFYLRADGVVVCTPGGSTAYNLSAGGPIITPDSECITVTPLNPFSLTHRPLVLNDSCKIAIEIINIGRLIPDGKTIAELKEKDIITISNHQQKMTMRHPRSYDYFDTLREKLYWRHP